MFEMQSIAQRTFKRNTSKQGGTDTRSENARPVWKTLPNDCRYAQHKRRYALPLLAIIVATVGTIPIACAADNFAVATVHPVATDAAAAVFREGGNAVDAAICAALTLSVVDNHNSGIGGGCLILVHQPNGKVLAIDGREMAPAASNPDMFLRDGVGIPDLSQNGPLAVGTPGALAAYGELLRQCGTLPLARLLEPGMKAAENGFVVNRSYAGNLRRTAKKLWEVPGAGEMLLHEDGTPYTEGETIKLPDLAATYRGIAQHGTDWFYRGPFAQRVGDWMQQNGGILTAEDFANYQVKLREPIRSRYRGRTVLGFPPPSSGGIHIAQMLNMLEGYDVATLMREQPVTGIHLVTEVMKLAFADRAHWLGDADFVNVPRGLTSPDYAKQLARKISLDNSTPVPAHGNPPDWNQDFFGRHTTHIATADAQGYWVSITATVNTSFGSKVIVPGTGVVLNNEMDDFSIQPGVPNAFGLVGAANNAVAPGKRPLSSMSPTILLDEAGKPTMSVGAAGGPKIITQVLRAIISTVDQEMSPAEALAQKRFHHQWRPDKLMVERGTPESTIAALKELGHQVDYLPSAALVQVIQRKATGEFIAVHDPRVEGKAIAE